jgi:hypothetical protein
MVQNIVFRGSQVDDLSNLVNTKAHSFVGDIEEEIAVMKGSDDEVLTKVSLNIKCNNVLVVVVFSLTCIAFVLNSLVWGGSWCSSWDSNQRCCKKICFIFIFQNCL